MAEKKTPTPAPGALTRAQIEAAKDTSVIPEKKQTVEAKIAEENKAKPEKVAEATTAAPEEDKVLIHMAFGRSWLTPSGVRFTAEHPYQLVPVGEAATLLEDSERFKRGKKEDALAHYRVNNDANSNNIIRGT